MMRTWTLRTLASLIAVAVAVSAAHAGPETLNPDDKLNQVLDKLQEVTKQLSMIQAAQFGQIKTMQEDVARLRIDVDRLNDELKRLPTTATNIAASINPTAPALGPALGRIILENRYTWPATFVVNNQPYRVMPGDRIIVTAPVGLFTTSVSTDDYGIVPSVTNRFLMAGRDYPIWVHP